MYRNLVEKQRAFFLTGKTKDINYRLKYLLKLKKAIVAQHSEILDALYKDLGKCEFEAFTTELTGPLDEINLVIKKLRSWSKPQKVKTPLTFFKATSQVYYEPFGSVLVISAWNYPFTLGLMPLIGALAAGNCCVLKPSELAPNTSRILFNLISSCFEEDYCAVIEGGVETSSSLLRERFDLIHYTGSTAVGKIIAKAAAEHLTPVILELGGKSPCIVDQTANIEVAARRICWGKFINAGQTCIAPDYIWVHEDVKKNLVAALEKELSLFFTKGAIDSREFCRIVNQKHFDRIITLLEGSDILIGGQTSKESLHIEPTIIDNVDWDSPVMKEEIFGPILPILTYRNLSEITSILNSKEKPLALYIFSNKKETQRKIIENISFGGGCINATVMHMANPNLPFGGVGSSGMGYYHGKWGFEIFSHKKSILKKSTAFDFKLLYPPYRDKVRLLKKLYLK